MKKLILRLGGLTLGLTLMLVLSANTTFAGVTPAISAATYKEGRPQILVRFNVPVWGDSAYTTGLATTDFTFTDGGADGMTTISSIIHTAGSDWAILTMNANAVAGDDAEALNAVANSIFTVGGALSEKAFAGGIAADAGVPTITSVTGLNAKTAVLVSFSEPVFNAATPTAAANLDNTDVNYTDNGGDNCQNTNGAGAFHLAGNDWLVVFCNAAVVTAADIDDVGEFLNAADGASIYDAFGNAVAIGANVDFTADAGVSTFSKIHTADAAIAAEANVGNTKILVKFSEPVFNAATPTITADLETTDFTYTNTSGAGAASISAVAQSPDQKWAVLTVNTALLVADLTDATADTVNAVATAVNDAFAQQQATTTMKLVDNTDPVILSTTFNQSAGANTLAVAYSEKVQLTGLTTASATLAASTATVLDLTAAGTLQGVGVFGTAGNVTVPTTLNSAAISSDQTTITLTVAGGTNGYMANASTTAPSGTLTPDTTGGALEVITDLNPDTGNLIEATSVQTTLTTTTAWDLTKPTILSALLTDSYINASTSSEGSDGRVDKLVLTASETLKAVTDAADTRNDWTLTSNTTEFGTGMVVTSASAAGSSTAYTIIFRDANTYYDTATFTLAAAADEWSLMDRAGNILPPTSKVCMSGFVCSGGTTNYAVTTLTITKPDTGDTTPPAKPTGLKAEQDSDGNVELSWTAPADADLSKVNIYRAKNGAALTGNIYAAISAGTSTYTDTDIVPGEVIEYAFKAIDASNNASALTASVTITVEEVTAVEPVEGTLSIQNESGQSGTFTLTEADGKTTVTLALTGNPEAVEGVAVEQPAHIHMGSCAELGDAKYTLTNVVDGASVTVLDMTIEALKAELPLALNVHKSAEEPSVYYACGDILPVAAEETTEAAEEEVAEEETGDEAAEEEPTAEEVGEPTPVPPASGEFPDTVKHWAKAEIAAMTKAGIIKGNADGKFKPDNNINRAEVAILLCRISGDDEEKASKNPFGDVKAGAWYGGCVSALKTAGIIKGNPDGTFKPTSDINRAEFLTLALRLYVELVGEVEVVTTTTAYTDLKTDWYTETVATATKLKFIQGSTCGTGKCFYAEKPISRAEAAVILYRMFKSLF